MPNSPNGWVFPFLSKRLFQKQILYRDFQAGSLLGKALKTNIYRKVKGTGFRWKENLNCDAVSRKISAGFTGSSEALIILQSYSKSGQNSQDLVLLYWSVGGYRLPWEGDMILGGMALLAEAVWVELIPEGIWLTSLLAARKEAL